MENSRIMLDKSTYQVEVFIQSKLYTCQQFETWNLCLLFVCGFQACHKMLTGDELPSEIKE